MKIHSTILNKRITHLAPSSNMFNWRSWSTAILYFPLTIYLLIRGLLKGKLFYFAASNPKLPLGGFASQSKYDILSRVPHSHKPNTILINHTDTIPQMMNKLNRHNMSFPLFVKPNRGDGGFLAKKINHAYELYRYHKSHQMDYIIQCYINAPVECSVLFHYAHQTPHISSITEQRYFKVIGNGRSTLLELIQNNPSGQAHFTHVKEHIVHEENRILNEGEEYVPVPIGHRHYGASFIDQTHCVTPFLLNYFNQLNHEIKLFHYAQYDIKCTSLEALLQGEFIIIGIKGIKGEPTHIYDHRYGLWKAYRELFKHWQYIFQISKDNIQQGAYVPNALAGFTMLYNDYQHKQKALKEREFNLG